MTHERYFTIEELAQMWGMSEEQIFELFKDEPGVRRVNEDGEVIEENPPMQ